MSAITRMRPMATSLLRAAAIGAGLCILAVGLAIAQTAPAPSPGAGPSEGQDPRRAIAEACRAEIGADLAGQARREAMRKCTEAKREAAGLNQRGDRRAERASARERRQAVMKSCREQLKDQRFTEAERREAMQGCIGKSDPQFGKAMACRKEADEKKLERGTRPFRQFMRDCVQPA